MISALVVPPPVASFLERRGRLLLALLALGMAAVVATTWESDELDRGLLVARARFSGLPSTRKGVLAAQLRRESDPGERRIATVRNLYLFRKMVDDKKEDTATERLRRLEAIERFAAEALELNPASWEASMFVGASRFERMLIARDSRLFSAAVRWELPMSAAVARSHGGNAAEQSLAAAYLEVYPALSPMRRPQVADVLRNSFTDFLFRQRHLGRWLWVAGSLENAEKLLPLDFETLDALANAAWRRGDSDSAVEYFARKRRQLRSQIEGELEKALRRPGELSESPATVYSWVVRQSAVDQEFVPFVEQALARIPKRNVIDPRLTDAAVRWRAWAQPLCLVVICPLGAKSFERLAALAAPRVNTEASAFDALAAGDSARAERLANEAGALATETWAGYLLFAARKHLERDEPGKAALLLNRVHPAAKERPLWAYLQQKTGLPQHPGAAALLRQESWGPASWRATDSWWTTLEMGVGRRSPGLHLDFRDAGKTDLLLGLEWDGRRLEPRLVRAGERSLQIPLDITPGLHLLRLSAQAGKLPPFGTTSLD